MIINIILLCIVSLIFFILLAKVIEVKIKRFLQILLKGFYLEIKSDQAFICLIFGIIFSLIIYKCTSTNWINFIPKIFIENSLTPDFAIFLLFLFFLINVLSVGYFQKNER